VRVGNGHGIVCPFPGELTDSGHRILNFIN
jgi:hypothetical protein